KIEPMASSTASETKFSEGISSRPVACRRASSARTDAICSSTASRGRFILSFASVVIASPVSASASCFLRFRLTRYSPPACLGTGIQKYMRGFPHGLSVVGIIHRFFGPGPRVIEGTACIVEKLTDGFLDVKAGVVRAQSDTRLTTGFRHARLLR